MLQLTIKTLAEITFDELQFLFAESKGCDGCWCMNHHFKDGTAPEGEAAQTELKAKFKAGSIDSLVAFVADEPVGWCAIDEKAKLLGHDCLKNGSQEANTWSIHCIFVNKAHRGKGISKHLIEAAIVYGKAKGAKVIEAYPMKVPPGKTLQNPQYLFSGPFRTYEKLGFLEKEKVDDFYTIMSLIV